jgi:hypothetical protein
MSRPACPTAAGQDRAEGPAPIGTPAARIPGRLRRGAPQYVPKQAVKSASSRPFIADAEAVASE